MTACIRFVQSIFNINIHSALIPVLFLFSSSFAQAATYASNELQIVITPDGFPIIWNPQYPLNFTLTSNPDNYPIPGSLSDFSTMGLLSCYEVAYDSSREDWVYTNSLNGNCSAEALTDGAAFYKEIYVDGKGIVRVYYDQNGNIVGTIQTTEHMAFKGNFGSSIANDTYITENDAEVVGTISGSFEVSPTGAALYTVPVVMPPGIAGMKPDLSFVHSSMSSNGLMGVGWSLSGLSSITRCAETIATDDNSGKINFNERVFCLDGQRLLGDPLSREFRTETESFTVVTDTTSGYLLVPSPSSFTAKTKAGLTYHYKRILATTGHEGYFTSLHARIWVVDWIEDTVGNRITYHYYENAETGEYYVTEIRYAYQDATTYNAKIAFEYDSNRDDEFSGWVAGEKVAIEGRLRHVKTYSNGSLVRDYRVRYTKDAESNSTLLAGMKLCAGNSSTPECYKETIFNWDTTDAGIGVRVAAGKCADGTDCRDDKGYIYYPDLNGDGLSDMCYQSDAGIRCFYGNGSGGWGAALPILAECEAGDAECYGNISYYDDIYDSDRTYTFQTRNTVQFVDINGDGLDDFVFRGKSGIRYAISTGSSFQAVRASGIFGDEPNHVSVNSTTYNNLYFPDTNGDGVRELCYRANSGIKCHEGTGNSTSPWSTTAYFSSNICAAGSNSYGVCNDADNYSTIRFIDLDGDKKEDLVYRSDNGLQAWFSTGTGFTYDTTAFNVPTSSFFLNSEVSLCANSYSFGERLGTSPHGAIIGINGATVITCENEHASTIQFADVNADGLPDLCYRTDAGIICWKNRGFGEQGDAGAYGYVDGYPGGVRYFRRWADPITTGLCVENSGAYGKCDDLNNAVSIRYVDLNGDGKSDLTYRGDNGLQFFLSTGNGFIHRLATDLCAKDSQHDGACDGDDNWKNVRFADFNGDGRADLVYRGDQGIQTWVNNSYKSNLLTGITNGLGVNIGIAHKRLTDNSVYQKGVNNYQPILKSYIPGIGLTTYYSDRELQPAMCVVSSYTHDDGLGGSNTTEYFYTDFKVALDGRGSLGFASVESTDTKNIKNIVNFRQGYPYTGMVSSSEVIVGGQTVSEQINQTGFINFGNGRKFPFIRVAEENNWSYPAHTPTTNTKTTTTYDTYGNVENLLVEISGGGKTFTKQTVNTYTALTDKVDGRLRKAVVTHTEADGTQQIRASSFDYFPDTGLLQNEIIEPTESSVSNTYPVNPLTTSYVYDTFGNQISKTVSGTGITPRTTTTSYDASKRFIKTITNAKGHKEDRQYEALTGKMTLQVGPYITDSSSPISLANAVQTTWQYDVFGREQEKRVHDQTAQYVDVVTATDYAYCVTSCPSYSAKYSVTSHTLGLPAISTYFDNFGREVVSQSTNFDGTDVFIETQYDNFGRAIKKSRPYDSSTSKKWITTNYDVLDRITSSVEPAKNENSAYVNAITQVEYLAFQTKTTNPLSQVNIVTSDALGRQVSVQDAAIKTMLNTYTYSGNAQIKTTVDSMANVIETITDVRDNKRTMNDPDMGVWTYEYNSLGELVMQKDARGFVTRMEYDTLGRMLKRTDAASGTTVTGYTPSETNWVYDTEYPGQLSNVTGAGYTRTYQYDSLGRSNNASSNYSGQQYVVSKTYDNYGRPSVLTYPNNVSVLNQYNGNGYLEKVVDGADSTTIHWQANYMDVEGNITNMTYGNGVNTIRAFEFGRLDFINTGAAGMLQYNEYDYDVLGNLKRRTSLTPDKLNTLEEAFTYDVLNRLKSTTILGVTATNNYDELGNLTTKANVNIGSPTSGINYTYNDAVYKKRLKSVSGSQARSFTYDANGNVITAGSHNYEWHPFNKLDKMLDGANEETYLYDENRSRYRRNYTGGNSVDYLMAENNLGAHYEKHTKGSAVTHKYYIYAGGSMVAIKNETATSSNMEYLHKDHLGSVVLVTNETGDIVSERSFDAFGESRSTDWTSVYLSTLPPSLFKTATWRGYTGHEHIADFNLINMNGRIYDPTIGRFLSADPFVQYPSNMQSLNRYSYVMNNPLGVTDPSGYFGISLSGKSIRNAFKTAAVIAVGYYTGYWANGIGFGATGAGAIGGAAAGFTGGLLSGGGLSGAIRGGIVGGFTGAAFGEIHNLKLGFGFERIALHAVAGGLSSELQGGGFKSGFLAAGFTQSLSRGIGTIGARPLRAFAAAVAGGTASVIGGGKFGNGAITGAFSRLFNDEADWNAKAKTRSVESFLEYGSPYEGVYSESEWREFFVSDTDVTDLVPSKRLIVVTAKVAKYATATVDQARLVTTGEFQDYKVYRYRTVHDLENGRVTNEQRLFGSEQFIGIKSIRTGNNVRNYVETRTCYLGFIGC